MTATIPRNISTLPLVPTAAANSLVGERGLRLVWDAVRMVAPGDSTVLLHGETGAGKELVARAIYEHSSRSRAPYVKVSCAAIPAALLESELFGHERGAFTGAHTQRLGRFELADQGTIFLDEIGDLPLELQPKLLRVLQEREFERLGNPRTIRVNVRIVAATNLDLATMVRDRRFRADLFYRLNVFPIAIPPLRERPEDIPELVRHFVGIFAKRMNKDISVISDGDMEIMRSHHWPGNVRELQNFLERAVIVSPGPVLRPPIRDLTALGRNQPHAGRTLKEMERDRILDVLGEVGGVVGGREGAAVRLGLPRTTLISRMEKLGIKQRRTAAVAFVQRGEASATSAGNKFGD